MNNDTVVYVTEEGLEKIKAELDFLKNERRQEISHRLELAIAHGDLSENADYDYAKQEQAFVEGRIKDLEDSLRRAQIIDHDGRNDKVRVGSTVTVEKIAGAREAADAQAGLLPEVDALVGSLAAVAANAKALP